MAQVLKEETRQRIIKATQEELLLKGYDGASMRIIAKNSGMTVGNLYRYFKSKDDLITSIISPVLEALDKLLLSKSEDRISLYTNATKLGLEEKDVIRILDGFTDDFLKLYKENGIAMSLILFHKETIESLVRWFAQLIQVIAAEKFSLDEESLKQLPHYSRMLAVSIISGLQEGFESFEKHDMTLEQLRGNMSVYFRCFASMLSINLESLRG